MYRQLDYEPFYIIPAGKLFIRKQFPQLKNIVEDKKIISIL